ncbi:hypothetical protein DIPPA_18922 [Diplonema papillatum]|nr:hypothetical protein DIPPA_18922 [Diplonema papillatum]
METHVKLFYTLAFLAPSAVAQVCDSDQYIGFDGAVTTPGFSVNNTHLAAGSGSLNVNVEKAVYDLSLSGSQPGTISWFGFFENNDAELQVRVSFRTTGSDSVGDFIMYMARNGAFGMSFDGEEQTFTSSMIYTWHEWTATFDWKGRSITMHTDYTSQGTIVIPDKVVGVEALKLSQGVGTEGKFDTLRVLCPLAPPTVVVEPACPTAKDGGKLVFNRGGRRIGTSDAAALVPNTKHCGTAESECAPLNACSVTSGNFTVPSADQAVWEFKQLMAGEEKALKVCFFHDALDEWVQVGTIPPKREDN